MAKAKSPRINNAADKQVITMPEAGSSSLRKSVVPVANTSQPGSSAGLEEKIRQRAYELYEQRGFADGFDRDDWFRAENEIRGNAGKRQQSA